MLPLPAALISARRYAMSLRRLLIISLRALSAMIKSASAIRAQTCAGADLMPLTLEILVLLSAHHA